MTNGVGVSTTIIVERGLGVMVGRFSEKTSGVYVGGIVAVRFVFTHDGAAETGFNAKYANATSAIPPKPSMFKPQARMTQGESFALRGLGFAIISLPQELCAASSMPGWYSNVSGFWADHRR